MRRGLPTRAGDIVVGVLLNIENKGLVAAVFAGGGHRRLPPGFAPINRGEQQHVGTVEAGNHGADQLIVAARNFDIAGRKLDAIGRDCACTAPELQQCRCAGAQEPGWPQRQANHYN